MNAIIFYKFRRVLTQQQWFDELNSIFGDEAPSRTSVYQWYGEFNRGRSSLQDEFREGPKTVVVPETIDAVRQMISYREIVTTLGISGTSKHSINFFALDPTQFVNLTKKRSFRLVERNAPKIRLWCFETRKTPKVNSSRLYGCSKMSKIQQK